MWSGGCCHFAIYRYLQLDQWLSDLHSNHFPIIILFFRWIFPFVGHMGIAMSSGVIRDFAGPFYVSVRPLSAYTMYKLPAQPLIMVYWSLFADKPYVKHLYMSILNNRKFNQSLQLGQSCLKCRLNTKDASWGLKLNRALTSYPVSNVFLSSLFSPVSPSRVLEGIRRDTAVLCSKWG